MVEGRKEESRMALQYGYLRSRYYSTFGGVLVVDMKLSMSSYHP
jgi:hypothetical protein